MDTRDYYLFSAGQLRRKDDTIDFIPDDGDKKTRHIPVETINSLYIMNDGVIMRSSLFTFLSQTNILCHFFNYNGNYSGTFYPKDFLQSGDLLVKQVLYQQDAEKRLYLAKQFVLGAANAIYQNLRKKTEKRTALKPYMEQIAALRKEIERQPDVSSLMGVEGSIRREYFAAFPVLINQKMDFEGRVMHPPNNAVNAMISFVNALMYTACLNEIYHTQLNPTISYLHSPGTKRFSLVLDLSEIFKPMLGDRMIFSLINKNEIGENDFRRDTGSCTIKVDARKKILQRYKEILESTFMYKELRKNVSYRYAIRLEAYKLVKHLLGEKQYVPFYREW